MTTPADTLTTAEKAGIVEESNPTVGLGFDGYNATSADDSIATIEVGGSNTILVVAQAAGPVDVTVTRLSDSAVSVVPVTITGTGPGAFVVHLGTAVPK